MLQPQDRLRIAVAVVSCNLLSHLYDHARYKKVYMSDVMMNLPVTVGLGNAIQPRRWIALSVYSYDYWITSFCNAVFPAGSFCQDTCAVTSAYTVIVVLCGVSRKCSCGVKPFDVGPNEIREFLNSYLVT